MPPSTAATGSPEAAGFSPAGLANAVLAIREAGLHVHSLIVRRGDTTVLDATFYPYDGLVPHDQASVTKSVMTTLIGIAVGEGALALEDRVLSFFANREIANLDAGKRAITVAHLASMSAGLSCTAQEDERTLREMKLADDYVQFVLDRPMMAEPGTAFVYCSPAMHLLSAVLQAATGRTAGDYARDKLFTPLGISQFIWPADDQGIIHGWGNLRLMPADAVKLGQLWLNRGQWDGVQVVPADWVEAAVRRVVDRGDGGAYGYGWWIAPPGEPQNWAAIGRGGQRITVMADLDLAIGMTGGGVLWDAVAPLLLPELTSPDGPLPADRAGSEALAEALETIRQAPPARPVPPPPEPAAEISGNRYEFAPGNVMQMTALGFSFTEGDEASMTLTDAAGVTRDFAIGLDGCYRFAEGEFGLPVGVRGTWTEAGGFAFEYDRIANNHHLLLEARFDAGTLALSGRHTSLDAPVALTGRLAEPAA